MKTKFILPVMFIASVFFTACNKDKDEKTPFNAKYADLSIEENKANLEEEGIAMVNELEGLKNATAIEVAINFEDLSSNEVNGRSVILDGAAKPVNLITSIAYSRSYKDLNKSFKTALEDPETFTEMWNDLVGKYTWNANTYEWDYTEQADKIIFLFPGKKSDTKNSASITISNYTFTTIANPGYEIDDEFGNDFPTGLKMELAYNSSVVSTFNLSAAYTNDGIPTNVELILTVDDFSMSAKTTHKPYTNASVKYTFKRGSEILVEMYADASGNWSEENIDNNMVEIKEFEYIDWEGDSVFYYYTDPIIENILTKGNAYMQVMNIKVAGMIDVKSYGKTLRDLEDNYEKELITSKVYIEKLEEACNKYIKLVVVYADTEKKIAAAVFKSYYEEMDSEWGSSVEYGMNLEFVFADGSRVDAETYISDGFDTLTDEINNFIDSINEEYGSDF